MCLLIRCSQKQQHRMLTISDPVDPEEIILLTLTISSRHSFSILNFLRYQQCVWRRMASRYQKLCGWTPRSTLTMTALFALTSAVVRLLCTVIQRQFTDLIYFRNRNIIKCQQGDGLMWWHGERSHHPFSFRCFTLNVSGFYELVKQKRKCQLSQVRRSR